MMTHRPSSLQAALGASLGCIALPPMRWESEGGIMAAGAILPFSGEREENPYVCRETPPTRCLLRVSLRALVVALDPVRFRSLPPAHRELRALPRGDRRASGYPRQGWRDGATKSDGTLARLSCV